MKPIAIFAVAAFLVATPVVQAATISVAAGADAQERLQGALIDAKPGDVVEIGPGRFDLTDGLSLDVANVTVKGAGRDATILNFKGQKAAGEGLLVTSNDVILRDFAVEDARGDAIKSKGVQRIVFTKLRVEWTAGPKTENGAYGVYPVASTDVLIDDVIVKGASDAGIYVGQSRNIIVRNSLAMYNVAGIEIENSYNADVYSNRSVRNTGGILIFDLPNLPQQGGHAIRIFSNRVELNDTPNFAAPASTVSQVPVGTGVMVMANSNVHVYANALGENATANIFVVAYKRPFTDAKYNPFPKDIVVRDNVHGRAGWKPGFAGGKELAAMMGGTIAPVFWDGVGGEAARVHVGDKVPALTLGLPEPLTPPTEGKVGLIDLSQVPMLPPPPRVVLPAAMEAAVR
jgi:parallel beta-helix repeat protein